MKHIATVTLMLSLGVACLHAQSASQIVLSCTTPGPTSKDTNGCISSEGSGTPPIIVGGKLLFVGGFWVWCQSPSGGGTPYGPDCNGAMYVAEVNLSTNVVVYQTTSVSGTATLAGGALLVTFTSSDGDMKCVLTVPTSPTRGGTNTLSGSCDGVPIVFSQAVVQVTR